MEAKATQRLQVQAPLGARWRFWRKRVSFCGQKLSSNAKSEGSSVTDFGVQLNSLQTWEVSPYQTCWLYGSPGSPDGGHGP